MAYYATYMPNENGEMQKVVINAGVGFILPYYGETAPPGTLACDGSEISRAAYDELFQVLGTKAGAGNGTTTFNLPDLRGQFVRGTGGSAAALGTAQGDAIRDIKGGLGIRPLYTSDGIDTNASAFTGASSPGAFYTASDQREESTPDTVICALQNTSGTYINTATFAASRVVPTADENRPTNTALLWCIIYE